MSRHPLFQNAQWAVTTYGLECRTTGYDIAARQLSHPSELRSWPRHMAEKNWVDIRLFIEALREAIRVHQRVLKYPTDDAAFERCCARAIAISDYTNQHSATMHRIAREQNIGSPVGDARIFNIRELDLACDLATAELAAAGIHSPE